jgi:integrase/recombinase XerC/integrase/recombinase XerD
LKDSFTAFMSRCQALNLAGGTLTWYRHILGDLAGFLADKGVHGIEAVEPSHLRDFLVSRRQKGHSSQTVDRTYGAVRCVFRFWNREGMLSRNPMALVDRPRKERNLIRPFSAEQATQLISQPDGATFEGLRDRAMIMLMLDSGLRVSEVRSLEADRIDWMSCTMTVMGKGRKERSIPFSARTCQALLEYSRLRAQKGVRSPQFFVGRSLQALERTKVRRIIMRYGKKAPENPWGAVGLEWETASPPPTENFPETPVVIGEAYDYTQRNYRFPLREGGGVQLV